MQPLHAVSAFRSLRSRNRSASWSDQSGAILFERCDGRLIPDTRSARNWSACSRKSSISRPGRSRFSRAGVPPRRACCAIGLGNAMPGMALIGCLSAWLSRRGRSR